MNDPPPIGGASFGDHRRRRPGRPVDELLPQGSAASTMSCSRSTASAMHGGRTAGTRSAWSRPTGSASCRAFRTAAPTRTASCCATRSSTTSTASSPRSIRRCCEGVTVTGLRATRQHGVRAARPAPGAAPPTRWWSPPAATTMPVIPRWPSGCRQTSCRSTRGQYRNPAGAAGGRRAGGGQRPVRLPDRRGPAPRRPPGAPVRRRRAAHGAPLSRQGRGRLAARDGLLRHAGARASAARGRARQDQPLRHRPRRRARHRPAPAFALEGMQLYGRLLDVAGGTLAVRRRPRARTSTRPTRSPRASRPASTSSSPSAAIDAPPADALSPVWGPPQERRDAGPRAAGIRSIVWCIGFRADYRWIDLPVFDGRGQPAHVRGVTAVPGLYFLGLPWLYTWGSGRFSGVARDAKHICRPDRGTPGRRPQ